MIFNTVYSVMVTPSESGDNIKYPVSSPSGTKLYTEQYISGIGASINLFSIAEWSYGDTYTVSEMSLAIADISSLVTDVQTAINAATGAPPSTNVPLDEMPDKIASIPRGVGGQEWIIYQDTYTVLD